MPNTDGTHKRVLTELGVWIDCLKTANDELRGEKDPENPVDLVKRIRDAHSNIQVLLDEAERIGLDDSLVKRLRATHPARPAT